MHPYPRTRSRSLAPRDSQIPNDAAAGKAENPWAMPLETGQTLWVCRGRQPPMDKAWASFKHYS